MKDITAFLTAVVRRSARLCSHKVIVSKKGDGDDLVTNIDVEIEKYIIKRIKRRFPSFGIVSEELNNTALLSKNCFVIDPIDGTINFAHGLPLFGIQVACIMNGKTVSSVIYFPHLNKLFVADSRGAFCNGKRIRVHNKPCNKSIYVVEGGNKFPALMAMQKLSRHYRYICCASLNFAWVACGFLGGTILRKDNPWDYLPGLYMVEMAGGVVVDKDGCHVAANNQILADILATDGAI